MNILTYECLLSRGMDMKPQPCIAESWKSTSDTEWEFKIRKGVKFHDGTDMMVEDIKASIEWAKEFPLIRTNTENIKQVDIVDKNTIRITTYDPCAVILENLMSVSVAIVPKALIESGNDFNANPIGTGPYKFVKWTLGDSVEFEAFEDYWEGAPKIKKMTWKIIPEGSSRTIALEAGEIDFVVEVEQMDMDRIVANKDLVLYKYEATDINWLMLNNEKPGLDNQDVRHAINSAIDKDSVVTVAANGLGKVALSQCPSNLPGASDENADKYDVAKAKEYLRKSGIAPSDIKFSIICSNDMKKRAGEVVQANLKEIGISCTLETMDLATYLSATAEGNYTAAIGGSNLADLTTYVVSVYHSNSLNASNKTRLNSPEIDKLIDLARVTVDDKAREKVLQKVCAKLNSICAQVALWQPIAIRAFDANLKGVEINPVATLYFKNVYWG